MSLLVSVLCSMALAAAGAGESPCWEGGMSVQCSSARVHWAEPARAARCWQIPYFISEKRVCLHGDAFIVPDLVIYECSSTPAGLPGQPHSSARPRAQRAACHMERQAVVQACTLCNCSALRVLPGSAAHCAGAWPCAGDTPRGIQACEGPNCTAPLQTAPHLADALGALVPLIDASDALQLPVPQGLSSRALGSLAAARPPAPAVAAAHVPALADDAAPGLVGVPAPARISTAAVGARSGRSLLQRLADSGGALLARHGALLMS